MEESIPLHFVRMEGEGVIYHTCARFLRDACLNPRRIVVDVKNIDTAAVNRFVDRLLPTRPCDAAVIYTLLAIIAIRQQREVREAADSVVKRLRLLTQVRLQQAEESATHAAASHESRGAIGVGSHADLEAEADEPGSLRGYGDDVVGYRKVLLEWLSANLDVPYPDKATVERLELETGISKRQILQFYSNARRRYVPGMRAGLGLRKGGGGRKRLASTRSMTELIREVMPQRPKNARRG